MQQQQQEELRVDEADGELYSFAEFFDEYGDSAKWDAAGAPPPPHPRSEGSPNPAALITGRPLYILPAGGSF
jgi:hypothetical protein